MRVVDHLVEGAEKVEEARGEAKVRAPVDAGGEVAGKGVDVRLRGRPPVALHADVDVSRMDDTHVCPFSLTCSQGDDRPWVDW